jgi:hypothetical protein
MAEQLLPVEADFTLLKKNLVKVKRRGSVRYRASLATLGRIVFPASGESQEAWVQNLSHTGIGLTLGKPLEAGTPVAIRLTGTSKGVTLKLLAKVVHSTQEIDGTWRVGCALDQRLSPEVLETLL